MLVYIALLLPPMGCITQPYLSLPSLAAFLRSLGHEVLQHDVGIRAVDKMLTATHLHRLHESVLEQAESLQAMPRLTSRQREHMRALLLADLCAPDVINGIEDAKSLLRSEELFYQADRYVHASNIVRRALDLVSAAHFPTSMLSFKCEFGVPLTFDNVFSLTFSETENPFLCLMRDVVLPDALPAIPPIVGISVPYKSQIVPGYTLARLIKSLAPTTHVVMGGATITLAEERIRSGSKAFRWVDSYVFGEGESAFAHLLEIIESDFALENKFNKLYLKSDCLSGQRQRTNVGRNLERERFDELPSPDYSGLNLDDYLSPETVFLLSNGRGCYYGKCPFCNVLLAGRNEYQERSLAALRRDIESLQRKHGARFFTFADDCVTPKRCREISEFAQELDVPIRWQVFTRFEKGFTRELLRHMQRGGCCQINVGNESGNQRVLNLMRKDTNVETNRKIVQRAAEARIAIYISSFLGFPGETMHEALETVDCLMALRRYVTSIDLVTYQLLDYSSVRQRPEDYGVARVRRRNASELLPSFVFSTSSGATRDEVQSIYRQAIQRLGRAYPYQDRFLDGVCASHAPLYVAFFEQTDLRAIFQSALVPPSVLPKKRPQLKRSVDSRRLGTQTALYNRDNAQMISFKTKQFKWLGLADGTRTLTDILNRLDGAGHTRAEAAANAATVAVGACDLHLLGFLDLD